MSLSFAPIIPHIIPDTPEEAEMRRQVEAGGNIPSLIAMMFYGPRSGLETLQLMGQVREDLAQRTVELEAREAKRERLTAKWEAEAKQERRTQGMQHMLFKAEHETTEWFLLRFEDADVQAVDETMAYYGEVRNEVTTWHAWRAYIVAVLFIGLVRGRDTPEQTVTECDNAKRLFGHPDEIKELLSRQDSEPQKYLLRLFGELLTLNLFEEANEPSQENENADNEKRAE